jgi:hypothetical protein
MTYEVNINTAQELQYTWRDDRVPFILFCYNQTDISELIDGKATYSTMVLTEERTYRYVCPIDKIEKEITLPSGEYGRQE